jgi:hypothetical protein
MKIPKSIQQAMLRYVKVYMTKDFIENDSELSLALKTYNIDKYGFTLTRDIIIDETDDEENVIFTLDIFIQDKTAISHKCTCQRILTKSFVLNKYSDFISLYEKMPEVLTSLKQRLETFEFWLCSECNVYTTQLFSYEHDETYSDICQECYTYSFNNTEVCTICHETGFGMWIKPKCCHGQFYHYRCIKEISKCPTCRQVIQYDIIVGTDY